MNINVMFMTKSDDVICQCRPIKLMVNDVVSFNMITGSAYLTNVSITLTPCFLRSYMCC